MLKVGIVGFGFIAQYGHTPFYREENFVQVVGIADSCEARLRIAKEHFPDAKLFSSAQEMFQELGPTIDVVDICTPPYSHYDLITEALTHGYHVICEKPLVTNAKQMQDLFLLTTTCAGFIYPCHNYQFSTAVNTIENLLAEDYVGTPHRVVIRTYRPTHARGVAEWLPHWRRQKKYAGGGILMDHGPHSLYLARRFLKNAIPEKVSCMMGSFGHNDFDTEDTVQLEIMYEQGVEAMIYLSWASTYRMTKYLIIGTRGYIELSDDVLIAVNNEQCFTQNSGARINDASHHNWYKTMFADFQEKLALFNKEADLSPLLEAEYVTAIMSAAYTSATLMGKWTSIEKSEFHPAPASTLILEK